MAFQSRDRLPVLDRVGGARRAGIRAARCSRLRRSRQVRRSSRTSGSAADRCAAGCRARTRIARSTPSKPAAAPACRSRASTSTTSASTTRCSARRCPTQYFPKGADWLQVGPSGPRRLRLAIEHLAQHRGGICFARRSRPALGHQADQVGRDGDGRGLQAPRHRPGAHADQGARRHPLPVHHAQAPRGAVRADLAEEGRHHRRLLRRHRDDAAVPSLRRRGADGRRVLRADLRQHADGAGRRTSRVRRPTTGP